MWAECATICVGHGKSVIFAVGCYIPLNDLSTLATIKQAWNKCPRGHTPILLGDLNINLCTPRDKRDEEIAQVVEDMMSLDDLSQHFHQQSQGSIWVRWTWRMRRGRRWIPSQCNYFLGWVNNHRKYCSIWLHTPNHYDSDHRMGSATRMAAYQKQMAKFPLKLPLGPQDELCTLYKEL
jgi:hypothetical protein